MFREDENEDQSRIPVDEPQPGCEVRAASEGVVDDIKTKLKAGALTSNHNVNVKRAMTAR